MSFKEKLHRSVLILKLAPKLGFYNVLYMAWYRFTLRFGLRKRFFPVFALKKGQYFKECQAIDSFPEEWKSPAIDRAERILGGNFTWFSKHTFSVGPTPDWFYNPFSDRVFKNHNCHWTEIKDFADGDIKIIWDLSRFHWLTDLARAYKITGKEAYWVRMNTLLSDWTEKNPVNLGPNWKCGQETSIRIIRLLSALHLLDQLNQPYAHIQTLVYHHLIRVSGNVRYAMAQDNNHGTSEAAALYIGAAWLMQTGYSAENLNSFRKNGRRMLINRIDHLILRDGTFAQKSMNYHRMVTDTMSFVLQMMSLLDENPFPKETITRLKKLGEWQTRLTFGRNGQAPNYGSNDGSLIENLNSCDYVDYRPSTQTFFAALENVRVYPDIYSGESMFWRFGAESLTWPLKRFNFPDSEILDDQLLLMQNDKASLMLVLPHTRFRQANDAFHIELWVNGVEILRGTGTYSYNDADWTLWFKSVKAHNTVAFGEHNQLPLLGPFLNAEWFSPTESGDIISADECLSWSGSYRDARKNMHTRTITLSPSNCIIEDNIISAEEATAIFHVSETNINTLGVSLEAIPEMKIGTNQVSYYYLHKDPGTVYSIPMVGGRSKLTIHFPE